MTTQEKNKLNAKAEAILMGLTQMVDNNEEAKYILDYILKVVDHKETSGEQILKDAFKYDEDKSKCVIKAINVSEVMDMLMIALPMVTAEAPEEEFDLLSRYGVFSYVVNLDCPYCSELGYTFFGKSKRGNVHRLG